MTTIRPAQISDISRLQDLQSQNVELSTDKEPWSDRYFTAVIKDGIVLVAESDGQVVGFVAGELLVGNGAMLWMRIVDDGFKGRGVGKQLRSAFEDAIQKSSATWIISYVDPENTDWYKRDGAFIGGTYTEVLKDF